MRLRCGLIIGGVSKKQFEITSREGYSGATIHFRQDNNFGTLMGYDADRNFIIWNLYPSKSGYKVINLGADDTHIGGYLYVAGSRIMLAEGRYKTSYANNEKLRTPLHVCR